MVKIQNATVALPMIILKHGKRDKTVPNKWGAKTKTKQCYECYNESLKAKQVWDHHIRNFNLFLQFAISSGYKTYTFIHNWNGT